MPRPSVNIPVGARFGEWETLDAPLTKRANGQVRRYVTCRCSCGSTENIAVYTLTAGTSTRCGECQYREAQVTRLRNARKWTPGKRRAYASWQAARTRCLNPKSSDYENYGARGIKFSPKFASFDVFLAHLGERPEGTTLDRINVNGDYAPGNVRWADARTQRRNQRARRVLQELGVE